MRYALSDCEWSIIQPILPTKPRGIPRVDDRRVLNGIFWVLRSGAPWRDLPRCFGPYTTCYNRFNRWGKAGIWDGILNAVANARNAEVQMLDTTIVRGHQHGACAKQTVATNVGRSRGGLTTKIHAVVDGTHGAGRRAPTTCYDCAALFFRPLVDCGLAGCHVGHEPFKIGCGRG
jgi:transposase